ncbi:MAG: radical SAM protein [Candidatus Omnitrophica bacterium]|nr:radical SAM protein [Candidatus Omnitrophota bacterium]
MLIRVNGMKILILNPALKNSRESFIKEGRCEQRLSSFQYVMMPISLPSTAGLLRKGGHDVKILDCVVDKKDISEILNIIEEFSPSLAIVNISTATYYDDLYIVDMVKTKFPFIHLTGIGNHVSSLPEAVLSESKLDSIILGEPEFTSHLLLSRLSEKKNISDIEGFAWRDKDGKVTVNKKRYFNENLDEIPFPARDLMDNKKYTLPIINEPYALIISSRGCPYDCIFCTANQYYGKTLRLRSPEKIIAEIEEVRTKYGVRNVTMWSDTFTLDREFVVKICNLLIAKRLGVRWMCNSRVDKVDPGLLELMKKSGCMGISYGIESGNQEILDNIKKKITILHIKNAIKWTRQAGIESLVHVIFGLPGETRETIEETTNFIIELDPDYAQFYCAIPFPGTEFYNICKKNGWLITENWKRFELNQAIVNTALLSAEDLHKARVCAYKRFYIRPGYVLSRLKKTKNIADMILLFKQGTCFMRNWVLSR